MGGFKSPVLLGVRHRYAPIATIIFILRDGIIEKCFYPVFPPDKNVVEVMAWLSENQSPSP
jgi:peroxiredoxin